MKSCLLYHGPGAQQSALDEAGRIGRLIHEPFGSDKGLPVDDARTLVALLLSAPIGLDVGVVIAGPMDRVAPKSSDVLLKTIEEFNGEMVCPILWAYDLGGVRPTIRSRCLDIWCPPTGYESVDEELEEVARELVSAVLGDRIWEVPPLVGKMKGRYEDLLGEMALSLSVKVQDDPKARVLWEKVRGVAMWRNPSKLEIVAALLPGD